ncbi:hypothetical protein TNCV_653071 [Trichonephila clavipes]|nr:hypothetical protein TNCV_653071 [Trichonephila clavipes]
MHVKYVEAQTSSRWYGVDVRRRVPAQVSFSSLGLGLKLLGPSPIAFEQFYSATLIYLSFSVALDFETLTRQCRPQARYYDHSATTVTLYLTKQGLDILLLCGLSTLVNIVIAVQLWVQVLDPQKIYRQTDVC